MALSVACMPNPARRTLNRAALGESSEETASAHAVASEAAPELFIKLYRSWAWGDGAHPSTQLVCRWLLRHREHIRGKRICGTTSRPIPMTTTHARAHARAHASTRYLHGISTHP